MQLTAQQLAQALQDIGKVAKALESAQPEFDDLKAAAQNFVTLATAALPPPPDGETAWSQADLDALAAGNHTLAQQIIAQAEADK